MSPHGKLMLFSTSDNLDIGCMFECAMDNAGLDGHHWDQLTDEQAADVLFHLECMVDSKGLPYASDAAWRAAAVLLKS